MVSLRVVRSVLVIVGCLPAVPQSVRTFHDNMNLQLFHCHCSTTVACFLSGTMQIMQAAAIAQMWVSYHWRQFPRSIDQNIFIDVGGVSKTLNSDCALILLYIA